MSDAVGMRYAKALFELAKESKSVDKVNASLTELAAALEESSDMQNFVSTPLYAREHQISAITAVAKKAKAPQLVENTMALMASKGRLATLPHMIRAFQELVKSENEEITVQVTSAKELTAAQTKKLAAVLKSKVGKDVAIDVNVDPEILGGLIVNIGSTMIDNSLKGKLSKLHNSMKEVG